MKLRDYQQAAVDAVLKSWQTNKSCLLVLPTGCGKTVVFGEVIRRRLTEAGGHAMVLAHREELIAQAEEKVAALTGASVDIEMGPRQVPMMFDKPILPATVVSSVQTQITGRMNKFDPADFSTLVIDEAHHATSKSYRKCAEHYLENPSCRLLGVTATPDRADETALGTVFNTVAYEYSVDQAIRDGWLVPIRQKMVTVGTLDFSQVSTTAGDFNQAELGDILEEERNLHGIASPTIDICGERRAIVFATTVRQAERLAEIINRHADENANVGHAEWLCGKTPKMERKNILDRFRAGTTQFLVNVGVLTEGFDDAGVEVVVMARPTKSRALYSQMAGRATRPAADIAAKLGDTDRDRRLRLIRESSKPSCLIVDFVGNSGRHKLVSVLDILGGKELDPDEEEAQRIVRRKCEEAGEEGLDTQEELANAREEVKRRKIEDAKRRAFIRVTAKYTTVSIDPFNVYDLAPMTVQERCALDRRTATFKQRRICRELIGIDPDRLRYSEIKGVIDAYFGRRERGLSTLRQTKFLRKHGVMMPMSFKEASATIGRLMAGRR